MNATHNGRRADKRQAQLPNVPVHRRYVPVTISLKPAVKARLDAIAAARCKGAWIGAVKYSDVIREGIDLVIAREDKQRAEAEGAAAARSLVKVAPKRKRGGK